MKLRWKGALVLFSIFLLIAWFNHISMQGIVDKQLITYEFLTGFTGLIASILFMIGIGFVDHHSREEGFFRRLSLWSLGLLVLTPIVSTVLLVLVIMLRDFFYGDYVIFTVYSILMPFVTVSIFFLGTVLIYRSIYKYKKIQSWVFRYSLAFALLLALFCIILIGTCNLGNDSHCLFKKAMAAKSHSVCESFYIDYYHKKRCYDGLFSENGLQISETECKALPDSCACLRQLAIKTNNPILCRQISAIDSYDENIRNKCIRAVAKNMSDQGLCEELTSNNPEINSREFEYASCITNVAVVKGDANLCVKIPPSDGFYNPAFCVKSVGSKVSSTQ